jgi:hypothetical protein
MVCDAIELLEEFASSFRFSSHPSTIRRQVGFAYSIANAQLMAPNSVCSRRLLQKKKNFSFVKFLFFIVCSFYFFLVFGFFFWKMGPPSRDVRLLCEVHSHVRGCCVVVVMV